VAEKRGGVECVDFGDYGCFVEWYWELEWTGGMGRGELGRMEFGLA